MEKPEIEDLITKKITEVSPEFGQKLAEVKLEVTEKRLHFVLWFGGALVAVFGVLLPLLWTQRSADRVDSAIQEMRNNLNAYMKMTQEQDNMTAQRVDRQIEKIEEKFDAMAEKQQKQIDQSIVAMNQKFDELSGLQLRKPVLECFVNGGKLHGAAVTLSMRDINGVIYGTFDVYNSGDAPAKNVQIRLYADLDISSAMLEGHYSDWVQMEIKDETNYARAYRYESIIESIEPKDKEHLFIAAYPNDLKSPSYKALLKIFYGQPDPKMCLFRVEIKK